MPITAEVAAAATPHGVGESRLRLALDLRLELDALLADIVVLEAERARELDERTGRGQEEERRWAREDGQRVRLGTDVAQRAMAARHECEPDAEEENHACVSVSVCERVRAHAKDGEWCTPSLRKISHTLCKYSVGSASTKSDEN